MHIIIHYFVLQIQMIEGWEKSLFLMVCICVTTSFFMPPWCRTIRRALLNLATLAIVSAAKHLSSLFGDCSICTNIGKPTASKYNVDGYKTLCLTS